MTKAEVVALLAVCKAAYGDRVSVDDNAVALWHDMLSDLESGEAIAAVKRHVATSPHPVTIADIRKAVADATTGLPGWEQAWSEVLREVRRVGREGIPRFSHEATGGAIAALGWREFCNSDEGDIGVWRAQFRDAYGGFKGRALDAANVGRLERHSEARQLEGASQLGALLPRIVPGESR